MNEKQLKICVTIIEGRDAAKAIAGASYPASVEGYKKALSHIAKSLHLDVLGALTEALKDIAVMRTKTHVDRTLEMWMCAAAFELINDAAAQP